MSRTPFFVERNPYFLSGTTDLNEQIYGFSSDLGDVDRYYLDAAPGKTYIISVSGVEADTFDPKLVIRNRAGEIVATNSGGLGSYDPVIHFKTDHGGGYTIDVVNEDDLPGSFSFVFSIQEDDYTNPYTRPYEPLSDPITGLQDIETKASFDSAIGDSVVTKKELEDLLYSAGDGGFVSAQELKDLRIISGHLSKYLAPNTATYYQQIFDNVVLGSVANEQFHGGKKEPEILGDIHAGSSSVQLDKLIGKWFLGKDLPGPVFPGDKANNEPDIEVSYVQGIGPLFDGNIEFTDVAQGSLSDCWLAAATASIVQFKPETIKDLFVDNGDGTFGVRFLQLPSYAAQLDTRHASEHWVTVNREVPVDPQNPGVIAGMRSSKDGRLTDQLWPSLLEKAAAQATELQIFSQYRVQNIYAKQAENSYRALDLGAGEALAMLQPSLVNYGANVGVPGFAPPIILDTPLAWQRFLAAYDSAKASGDGQALALSMNASPNGLDSWLNPIHASTDRFTFTNQHAYAVLNRDQKSGTFTFYNPWGVSGSQNKYVSPFVARQSDLFAKFLLLKPVAMPFGHESLQVPNMLAFSISNSA